MRQLELDFSPLPQPKPYWHLVYRLDTKAYYELGGFGEWNAIVELLTDAAERLRKRMSPSADWVDSSSKSIAGDVAVAWHGNAYGFMRYYYVLTTAPVTEAIALPAPVQPWCGTWEASRLERERRDEQKRGPSADKRARKALDSFFEAPIRKRGRRETLQEIHLYHERAMCMVWKDNWEEAITAAFADEPEPESDWLLKQQMPQSSDSIRANWDNPLYALSYKSLYRSCAAASDRLMGNQ